MYSFYIPRMSRIYTEEQIKIIFSSLLMIGPVKRVDLVPINKKFQRAFIHMEMLYDLDTPNKIKDLVFEQEEAAWVSPGLIDNRIYWILLKNKNPIDDTNMNIHQLANQMNTIIHYLKTLNDKIEKIESSVKKPETERPLGCLLDKLYDNPFFFFTSS
jgi:hypothetical protein